MLKDHSPETVSPAEIRHAPKLSDLTVPTKNGSRSLVPDHIVPVRIHSNLTFDTEAPGSTFNTHESESRAAAREITRQPVSDSVEQQHAESKRIPASFRVCETPADVDAFIELRNSLRLDHRLMLTPYTAEEYEQERAVLYLDENAGGGFGITDIGELISVFSLPGRRIGQEIILKGIELGATIVSCFDNQGRLPKLYESFGFSEYSRIPWDEAQAPAEWNYQRFGRPDVIYMRRIPL